jgi:lysyl-tRNA synthetase class 2
VAEHDDLRRREEKLEELERLGLPYLSNRYGPIRHAEEIKREFEALEGSRVRVAGRLMRVRQMGKASFAHILDVTGEIQLYFKLDALGENKYEYFKLLDVGDIVGCEGTVFKTRTGEITVHVGECELLSKAFRALPDKWHGIADVETRYRRRYLDLISNPDSRRLHHLRSAVIRAIRKYLDEREFEEFETPVLQPLYGGAAAMPFTTRYEALDMTAYLRIATELYLKRLIVAGFERVYEVGKDFRNEGFSRKNSPEFTMLELYQAYVDYTDIMALIEDLFATVAQTVLGTHHVEFEGADIDFTPPWRRVSVRDAVREHAGVDFVDESREALLAAVFGHGIAADPQASSGKLVNELVGSVVEPNLVQPTILYDFPIDFPGSVLAKRKKDQPDIAERFELYIGGMEIANAFTELNDPVDQLARMKEAAKLRGEEHQEVDRDYILALEHGMPPTGGLGFGVDRLVMILANAHHIRETILFPLLRPREDAHAES